MYKCLKDRMFRDKGMSNWTYFFSLFLAKWAEVMPVLKDSCV